MDQHDPQHEEEDLLFSLTGYQSTDGLEAKIAQALDTSPDQVMIVEEEEDRLLFLVSGRGKELVQVLNNNNNSGWHCGVAKMEEEVVLEEEEAYQMWQNMDSDSRTSHLKPVPSPDGEMVRPQHGNHHSMASGDLAVEDQSKRDPLLRELDNIPRIDRSNLAQANWKEPFVVTGCLPEDASPLLSRQELVQRLSSVQVRTGNRNTLVESGFDNSSPLQLQQALEKGCIVFSPVPELPDAFRSDLQSLLGAFPSFESHENNNNNDIYNEEQKYTLCVAHDAGFGIGMHKHNQAFFGLVQGTKKWYLAPASFPREPTHPAFYTTNSTHKCIQTAGEILYVPDQWYHEIFNLEYTAGIQALPA